MCDESTLEDLQQYIRSAELTRRQFSALGVGAGLAALLPRAADALDVTGADINVETPDGMADCYFVHPSSGKYPGVVIWPDVYGLRPAFKQMGRRLAESGYSVLVVNPYYRTKKAPIAPPGASFQDPETRKTLTALMQTLKPENQFKDANTFVDFLDKQAAVDTGRKIGTMGYCMGGPFVFRTAAERPDRVGAGATFHGAALVTDQSDSPHLLVPKIKAQFLIAIAESDDKRQPEAKTVLREAFKKAELPAEIEVYKGTAHGWCPPDSQVYNEAQAERAWSRLLVTFKKALA